MDIKCWEYHGNLWLVLSFSPKKKQLSESARFDWCTRMEGPMNTKHVLGGTPQWMVYFMENPIEIDDSWDFSCTEDDV